MQGRLLCFVVAYLSICFAAPVAALTELYFVDGSQLVVAADGNQFDQDPTPGIVRFSGRVGNFQIDMSSGLSAPQIGTPELPQLELVSGRITSLATGKHLQIGFSDKNLGGTSATYEFMSEIQGISNGKLNYSQLFDNRNIHFAVTDTLASSGPLTGVFRQESPVVQLGVTGLFALTTIIDIELPEAQLQTDFHTVLKSRLVPEPPGILGITAVIVLRRFRFGTI